MRRSRPEHLRSLNFPPPMRFANSLDRGLALGDFKQISFLGNTEFFFGSHFFFSLPQWLRGLYMVLSDCEAGKLMKIEGEEDFPKELLGLRGILKNSFQQIFLSATELENFPFIYFSGFLGNRERYSRETLAI